MNDDDGGADSLGPTVVAKKRPEDPFDALLREVAVAPSPSPAAPWEMLDQERYRILELLGSGGGGQVYKAYDQQLGRHVALKFLNAVGAEHAAQLVKEARTQARVKHAGVCQVYEVVEAAGRPFIAMQLIDGPTLGAAQLTLREKVVVLRQVAEAVQAAHELGIVHRDLKPSNIMLEHVTDGWRPYVMDFGLAREVDKTLTNGVVGTPQYMAPEQARGDIDAIGPLTDVWALGATLYTLLAGKPPFDGESMMAILRRVESEEPARLPSLPPELEAIILRCLEKVPAQRYSSAADLARDLAAFERGDPVSARPPGISRRFLRRARRHLALSSVIVAVAALAGALVVALRRPPPKWHAALREIEPAYEENASKPRVSPDGKWLLFNSDRSGEPQLYVQSVDGGPARLLRRAGQGSAPSWSSDGSAIYFVQDSSGSGGSGHSNIARMPLDESSAPVTLFAGGTPVECAGRLFYFRRTTDGLDQVRLHEPDGSDRELAHSSIPLNNLDCTRDGSRVIFVNTDASWHAVWLDIKDGVEHVLPSIGGNSMTPTFRPDGRAVVLTVRNGGRAMLWEQSLDGRPARQLTDGGYEFKPQFSPDGRRLYFSSESRTMSIGVYPLDGSPARHLASASADSWFLFNVTHDGRELIAFRRTSKQEYQMVAVSVADSSERVLGPGSVPVVSLDDQQIYFCDAQHNDTIQIMPRAGGPARTLARVPGHVLLLSAGPDALHVALSGETIRAWRQPYDGSPGAYEGSPEVSLVEPAAGGWSLATSAAHDTAIIIPPGPWPKKLPAETRFGDGRLTPDRLSLLGLDKSDTAWIVKLATGEERRLMRVYGATDLSLSPDGKTLYTIQTDRHTRRFELTNYAELPPL